MTTEKKEEPLGLKTKVRMDFVILLLSGAASFTLIYSKLVNMDERMQHDWTIQHQIIWTKQFMADNPAVKVPDAQAIVNMMNQRSSP